MSPNESLRIVVCGDEGVGKSSLITSLVKDSFVANIEHLLPSITIHNTDYPNFSSSYIPKTTLLIDTSSSDQQTLQKELKQADVILLVYSDHYTYERVSLHWMNMFRSMGLNLPIVICSNKSDLSDNNKNENSSSISDEFITLLNEFKEIESCIKCSAKDNYNITEAFYLCQRAIMHPITPLYDSKEGNLKPACISALKRVFFICDRDQDGYLNTEEFMDLQRKCFNKGLDPNDLALIKYRVDKIQPGNMEKGLTQEGFITLNKLYAEKGRHETIWEILRAFHYTDSLSLNDKFLYPKLDVNALSSVELGPSGYRFLVDLFLLFDKDNDGGLNEDELNALFCPTPGIPKLWKESNFPSTIVCNERGYVTLQGWLAQWNLTTFLDYKTTLEYLGYLGFENQVKALKVTKRRRRRSKGTKVYRSPINDRNVFNCFVLGGPNSGKTSLLESFLGRSYSEMYSPTIQPRMVVKDIELGGGKQVYLILEELGELEPAILTNGARLDQCDVILYCYDSSDPDSFQYLVDLRSKYGHSLDEIPCIFVALKADLDRQQQRCDIQPDAYTREILLSSPLHISSNWYPSLNELFIQVVNSAMNPSHSTPGLELDEDNENLNQYIMAGGAITFMTIVSVWIWKSSLQSSG